MKTGVSTASLFMRLENERALPLLSSIGVKITEVFLSTFSEYSAEFAAEILKNKGDVEIHSVHALTTQYEPQLFSGNPRTQADAYYWLERVMQAAKTLGAKYYTFHGTARMKKGAREKDNYPVWADGLREIGALCAEYGVKLCLENVEWAICNRPEVFSVLSKSCPNLLGVVDIKQARLYGADYGEYIRAMQGKIAHVHISDVDENGKMCLPGRGVFDFAELLKRLNGAGFDGPLLIEAYKDDYESVQDLKPACDYIDELLYKYSFQ